MSPKCPDCGSTYVVPDDTNGGAGRDVCRSCGHRAPVRDFYAASARDDLVTWSVNQLIEHKRELIAQGGFDELYMQHPVALPEGIEMDPITGNLRRARLQPDKGTVSTEPTHKPHYWWQDQ